MAQRLPTNHTHWMPWRGLFIPGSAVPHASPPIETGYSLVTLGLEALTGERITTTDIAAKVARFDRRAVLTLLSQVDAILEYDGVTNQQAQLALIREMLPGPLADRAARRVAADANLHAVAFSHQPLWMLSKLALQHADPNGGSQLDDDAVREIGRSLLALADHLDADLLPSAAASRKTEDANWQIQRYLIRNFTLHAREDVGSLLLRLWTMLVDLPTRPEVRADTDFVDLTQLLTRHAGVDPQTYLAVGFATLGHYAPISLLTGTVSKVSPVIVPIVHFASTAVGPEAAARVYSLASLPPDRYCNEILREDTRTGSPSFAFRTMRERPFVQFDDQILPLSQRFLKFKFTDGLLWLLRDFAEHERLLGSVRRFLGRLFELYVREVFANAYGPQCDASMQPRVHYERFYHIKRREYRSTDVVVDYGDQLVFVEISTSRPKLEPTQIIGLREAFDDDVAHVVTDNAKQLDRNIRDLFGGFYALPGLDPARVRRVYPVIVTPGPCLREIWCGVYMSMR